MDFSRRLYRWASEGVDMYAYSIPGPLVEAAASSRVVAKSHSPRFQTYTKEQLLPILDDKDSKNPQASKRVGDKDYLNVSW